MALLVNILHFDMALYWHLAQLKSCVLVKTIKICSIYDFFRNVQVVLASTGKRVTMQYKIKVQFLLIGIR